MAAISALYAATCPLSSGSRAKKRGFLGIMEPKSLTYDRLQVKASSLEEREKVIDKEYLTSSLKCVANKLSEDRKKHRPPPTAFLIDSFGLGRNTEDGFIFCQNFTIRSYEIGANRKVSLETLMNLLQEVVLNHFKVAGLLSEGFGSTPEMVKRNLIWVAAQIQVIVDRYPTWGDVIQVETWLSLSEKNKLRSNWLVLDFNTGQTLARASCVWVTMNKRTRKLSKFPDEVRSEIRPHSVERPPAIVGDNERKVCKLDDNTADEIRGGLTAKWNDLDVNEHVNNVKYVGWVLESTPKAMMESHELSSINIEYRRECGRDSILQSLIAISEATSGMPMDLSASRVECQHLLRLKDGPEVLRARTEWRSKHTGNPEALELDHA